MNPQWASTSFVDDWKADSKNQYSNSEWVETAVLVQDFFHTKHFDIKHNIGACWSSKSQWNEKLIFSLYEKRNEENSVDWKTTRPGWIQRNWKEWFGIIFEHKRWKYSHNKLHKRINTFYHRGTIWNWYFSTIRTTCRCFSIFNLNQHEKENQKIW